MESNMHALWGMRVYESDLIPRGMAVVAGWSGQEVHTNPFNRYGERAGKYALSPPPFDMRYNLGMQEAARDTRRKWKGL